MIEKAELHCHLEGTAPPALIKKLAAKHQTQIDPSIFEHEYFHWQDFLDFLRVYDQASLAIRTPEDYYDVTYHYLEQSAKEGVIYCELTSSPDHAANNGMNYQDHLDGITRAIDDAYQAYGIVGRIIISCVRHYGVDQAEAVAKSVVAHPHPYVVGFGMGGDETGYPPKQFKRAFEIAHEAGLGCTAHAGELVGPEGVIQALDHLPITRIGHGVRSIEDNDLLKRLVDENITLEVCPSSNVALGLYKNLEQHPLKKLIESNVKTTINSDDPPYFQTTIGQEYTIAKQHIGLDDHQILQCTRNAIEAAFVDEQIKVKLLKI